MSDPDPPASDAAASVSAEQAALVDALEHLLAPLARLVVARGLPFAVVDELLRRQVVREAHAAHPDLPEHRRVSRIATTTGLNRREVSRLIEAAPRRIAPERSPVIELFNHWVNHPDYRDPDGQPRTLPRTGPAPSFEALAQEINRDVHPRSLLEELLRLGLAELDPADDSVRLGRRLFVPRDDLGQMFGFLGANVGDHLAAAVDNVLHTGAERKPHFEQAVFGQGLTPAAVAELREAIRGHWRTLVADLSMRIDQHVAAGEQQPDATERVRFGLFSYHEALAPRGDAPTAAPASRHAGPRPRRTKKERP